MEDLFELNRQIADAVCGSSSRMREAAGNIPVCIAACVPTVSELCELLLIAPRRVMAINHQAALNQSYLEMMRLLSREAMLGNVASLLKSSLTLSQAQFMAGLTNRQISHLSLQSNVDLFAIDAPALQCTELQGIAHLHALASYQAPIENWAAGSDKNENYCLIPAAARTGELRWDWALNAVAEGLVSYRAKGKIIKLLTTVTHNQVKQLYNEIHGEHPPPGVISLTKAAYFINANDNNHHNGRSWNIQGSILLGEFHHVRNAIQQTPNPGWLLLHSYRSYLTRVAALVEAGIEIMDINQAYRLMTIASLGIPEYRQVERHRCGNCQTDILVFANREREEQPCPLCTPASRGRGHWRSVPPEKRTG